MLTQWMYFPCYHEHKEQGMRLVGIQELTQLLYVVSIRNRTWDGVRTDVLLPWSSSSFSEHHSFSWSTVTFIAVGIIQSLTSLITLKLAPTTLEMLSSANTFCCYQLMEGLYKQTHYFHHS